CLDANDCHGYDVFQNELLTGVCCGDCWVNLPHARSNLAVAAVVHLVLVASAVSVGAAGVAVAAGVAGVAAAGASEVDAVSEVDVAPVADAVSEVDVAPVADAAPAVEAAPVVEAGSVVAVAVEAVASATTVVSVAMADVAVVAASGHNLDGALGGNVAACRELDTGKHYPELANTDVSARTADHIHGFLQVDYNFRIHEEVIQRQGRYTHIAFHEDHYTSH
ncbi:hypothetical protein H4S08_002418, partial [Coemansia sp. RSA 1365]